MAGAQPRGVGQVQELTNQANAEQFSRGVPEWARGTNGVLLEGVELTYAPQAIGHGLNRIPKGWFEVSSYSPRKAIEDVAKRTSTNLTLIAHAEQEFWQYSGSTPAATTVLNERPIWECHFPNELLKVELTVRAAIAANGTNYRIFTVYKRAATDYSTAITLATRNTSADAITAFTPWEITLTGSESQLKFARGDILTFESTVNSGGATLSDAVVECDLDAVGPRKVDLWVY